MEIKFIVLALVITAAAGQDIVSQISPSTVVLTNKSLPLETIKHLDVSLPSHEKVAQAVVDNDSKIIENSKVEIHKTIGTPDTPETTTTKAATTTTTTGKPDSFTAAPTPEPSPEEGKWSVQNKTGGVCIVAQMELQFNITYPGININSTQNATIFLPKDAASTGNCSTSSQTMQLTWGKGHSFEIVFEFNKTSDKFQIRSLNLTVNVTDFKDVDRNKTYMYYGIYKPDFPAVPVKMSYKCDKEQMLVLNSATNVYSAKMLMSHTQLEAFMSKKNDSFSEAKDCEGFETPDIVPIAVGCVLSILVVIVLIAYLIGRRRSHSRGYLSMYHSPQTKKMKW